MIGGEPDAPYVDADKKARRQAEVDTAQRAEWVRITLREALWDADLALTSGREDYRSTREAFEKLADTIREVLDPRS